MAVEPSSDMSLTEDQQFQRVLQLFPVMRSRDYCEDDESHAATMRDNENNNESCQSSSQQAKGVCENLAKYPEDQADEDSFWELLNTAAESKLGHGDAQRFCDAFRRVHTELVYKTLTLEGIKLATKHWDLQKDKSSS